MPIQFFHVRHQSMVRGMRAWHAAQRYISTLPELSEWTLPPPNFIKKTRENNHIHNFMKAFPL